MKNNIIVTFFIILGMAISIRSFAVQNIPKDINLNIQQAVKSIPSTPPVRHIIKAKNLHWHNTGAFTTTQTIEPELYGSYYNGKMYSWKNGKIGSLQAHINEIRALASVTMIDWGDKIPGKTLLNPVNHVTVEAVTGSGYFNTKSAGWETGTIYDFKENNEMRFAHVWNISPNGRLFIWETLCTRDNTAKCQTALEQGISGKSPSNLDIHIIVADPAKKGVTRYVNKSS